MRETIGVDIDDTLYPFGEFAREILATLAVEQDDKVLKAGAYAHWGDWRTPPDIVGLDNWLKVIEIAHRPENIRSRTPFPDAVDVLIDLTEHNDLIYISHRHPETEEPTLDWLDACGFPEGKLICTSKPKQLYLESCRYLIDDRPKTLVEFAYDDPSWFGQRVGFGLHTSYNTSLTDIPRIKLAPTWKLLTKFFIEEGLITKTEKETLVAV